MDKARWIILRTRFLIFLETSSIPNVSFEIATEMSSLAIDSWVPFRFVAARAPRCLGSEGGYVSAAKIALAYSLGSKSELAKTAYSIRMRVKRVFRVVVTTDLPCWSAEWSAEGS